MMQQWLSRFDLQKLDKLAPVLFFIVMIWLCWRLASLFWWFIAPPQIPVIQPVILGSQQPVMPNIVRFSLFEEQGQNPQAQTQASLPLKLEGVVLASPRYLSSAVLRVNDKADSYRIGDKIAETGLELADVYWDRVIIRESSGQTREIKFGEASTTANIAPPPVAAPTSPVTPENNNTADGAIGGAIEQLQKDREQYLNQMGVNSGQNGFEVTDKTPPALRTRLGLKPGDRIISVNGQTLSGATNEAQLLEQIRKTGQAKIEIQRGDQTMTIQQSF
nr:type II secretion system protein N [Acinetobacter populi]